MLDLGLPGCSGTEVLVRVRELAPSVPTLVLTGLDDEAMGMRAIQLGAHDYLLKNELNGRTLSRTIRFTMERRRLEQNFRQLLMASPDGVVVVNAEGTILFANQAAATLFEGDPRTLVGRPSSIPVPEAQSLEIELPSGRNAELRSAPTEWEGALASVVSLRDTTERTQAEVKRRQLEAQLIQAQKLEAVGQLAAGVAHEVNSPTQFVSDNTYFLKSAFRNLMQSVQAIQDAVSRPDTTIPEIRQTMEAEFRRAKFNYLTKEVPLALDQSTKGLSRIEAIVDGMRLLAHPGGGDKQLTDLHAAIEGAVAMTRSEWKQVADLVVRFDPEVKQVPSFVDSFTQAILNLVVNAAHALADKTEGGALGKGQISVSTRSEGDMVAVQVSDNGPGIREEHLARIFEPFFTTKEVGRGTGQGLAIAHSIITQQHGGTIDVSSTPGQGTTFTIRLPQEP